MFLHIGYSRVVFKSDLIGIFQMNLRENPTNKQFLESANKSNFNLNSSWKDYKSFIVTDQGLLFSPVVPVTLAKRGKVSREQKG